MDYQFTVIITLSRIRLKRSYRIKRLMPKIYSRALEILKQSSTTHILNRQMNPHPRSPTTSRETVNPREPVSYATRSQGLVGVPAVTHLLF